MYATQTGVVLAQDVVRAEAAGNEIAALPNMLAQVELRGHVMVTDAGHAQKPNARAITERGASMYLP
ncbi:MAG: transposase [Methylacidiphilales bacterium]|nr:transposase [Candidatus Methylacidiphilales bacterium]